ncbi:MFS transporter [Streptomyces thermospinosisporus]
MDTAWFLQILDREGRLLADAAEQAGVDAVVPPCPGWRVRDLLRHTGVVHRWAAGFVAEGHTAPRAMGEEPALDGPDLIAWYRASHRLLVDTLAGAPADVECYTFLPGAPSALAFWARRQAHETCVHRFDAEAARGGTPAPTGTDFAVDGIDELLRGFHARRRSRVRSEKPQLLRVRATDADAVWTMRVSVAFLPAGALVALSATRVGAVIDRFGTARLIVLGFSLMVTGYVLFLRIDLDPGYAAVVLPTMLLVGSGFALAFPSLNVQATNGVDEHEQGMVSGLLNTSVQVGGALFLAVVTAVVTAHAPERPDPQAVLDSYRPGLIVVTGIAVAGLLISLTGLRWRRGDRRSVVVARSTSREAETERVGAP